MKKEACHENNGLINNQSFCYVNEPSNCTDLMFAKEVFWLSAIEVEQMRISVEACRIGKVTLVEGDQKLLYIICAISMTFFVIISTMVFVCILRKEKRKNSALCDASYELIRYNQPSFLHYLHVHSEQQILNPNMDIKQQISAVEFKSNYEVSRDKFRVLEQIGSGNFGTVNKGELLRMDTSHSNIVIAIKSVNAPSDVEIKNFIDEIKIMGYVKPHVNLVNMIGACTSELRTEKNLWLLLEYCPHGDLKTYLTQNKKKILSSNDGRELMLWSYDISKGMQYLAKNQIMHGDLAARNILLAVDILLLTNSTISSFIGRVASCLNLITINFPINSSCKSSAIRFRSTSCVAMVLSSNFF